MLLQDVVDGDVLDIFFKLDQILGRTQIMPGVLAHQLLSLLLDGGAVLKFEITDEIVPLLGCIVTIKVGVNLRI